MRQEFMIDWLSKATPTVRLKYSLCILNTFYKVFSLTKRLLKIDTLLVWAVTIVVALKVSG